MGLARTIAERLTPIPELENKICQKLPSPRWRAAIMPWAACIARLHPATVPVAHVRHNGALKGVERFAPPNN